MEVMKARANLYHLLSRAYLKEIDKGFLRGLRESHLISPEALNKPDDVILNELAEEYAALFIVSGGLPPYESVRLKGLLCQEPATEVEEFYKRCGLVLKDEWKKIFPDHLGLELEFMGYLCDRQAEAANRDNLWSDYQAEFFKKHLALWAFDYIRDLERCAFHPFYRELAILTGEFLESEREYLNLKGGDKYICASEEAVQERYLNTQEGR